PDSSAAPQGEGTARLPAVRAPRHRPAAADRHPQAERHPVVLALMAERVLPNPAPQALGDDGRAVEVGFRQDDGELVAIAPPSPPPSSPPPPSNQTGEAMGVGWPLRYGRLPQAFRPHPRTR